VGPAVLVSLFFLRARADRTFELAEKLSWVTE
jgi:hypothetical protein